MTIKTCNVYQWSACSTLKGTISHLIAEEPTNISDISDRHKCALNCSVPGTQSILSVSLLFGKLNKC